ncbi:MAG: hypothetical protein Athens041674_357 [Parcubacteria group bacterium Athens0416_74]|nr:MAG: hypothetical protein Athens041674_357 [Parcubacteria group bacterium Athens0416_74]
MRISEGGTYERTDIWREGKWLDLWGVVHVLSGISLSYVIYFLKFDSVAALVIAALLLIAYELWEAMVKIEEARTNRVMDVVVGLVSFVPTYLWLIPVLTPEQAYATFALVLTVNIIVSILGWMASRKAAVFEENMRIEYRKERERVQRGIKRLKERRIKKRARSLTPDGVGR